MQDVNVTLNQHDVTLNTQDIKDLAVNLIVTIADNPIFSSTLGAINPLANIFINYLKDNTMADIDADLDKAVRETLQNMTHSNLPETYQRILQDLRIPIFHISDINTLSIQEKVQKTDSYITQHGTPQDICRLCQSFTEEFQKVLKKSKYTNLRNALEHHTLSQRLARLEALHSPQNPRLYKQNKSATTKVYGRGHELSAIDDALADNHILFLSGTAGIGKTTLARYYANERYQGKIIFVSFQKDFYNTICNIRLISEKASKNYAEKYNTIIELLREETGSILLIDNFDDDELIRNSPNAHDNANLCFTELDSPAFQALKELNIPIIITTRIDFRDSTKVHPLENWRDVFYHYYTRQDIADEQIESLCSLLRYNTMAMILYACQLEENDTLNIAALIEEIKELKTIDNQLEVLNPDNENRTIFSHIDHLFQKDSIIKEEPQLSVIRNAILLPLDGLPRHAFCELTDLNQQQINGLQQLIRRNWIQSTCNDNQRRLFLHPLVREVLYKRLQITIEDCRTYCNNLDQTLRTKHNTDCYEAQPYAELAYEAYRILHSKYDQRLLNMIYLASDVFDNTKDFARNLKIAQEFTRNLPNYPKAASAMDELRYIEKQSGYAYTIILAAPDMAYKEQDYLMLTEAKKKLDTLHLTVPEELEQKIIIESKILGNMGAYYLNKGKTTTEKSEQQQHFHTALEKHIASLTLRQQMLQGILVNETQDSLKALIAKTYENIGTDYFYLNRLKDSVDVHKKALALRLEVYHNSGPISFDLIIHSKKLICGNSINYIANNPDLSAEERTSILRPVWTYLEEVLSYFSDKGKEDEVTAVNEMKERLVGLEKDRS